MEFFLALLIFAIAVAIILNIKQEKSDNEYNNYLLELDELKKRKDHLVVDIKK